MTKEETIKIMAMLNAFYAGGKNDPKMQATAWHLVLEKYDYQTASQAVIEFAENDTREYATFPAVGLIVNKIRELNRKRESAVRDVVISISYGRDYSVLGDDAKRLISQTDYNEWLNMDAEVFAGMTKVLTDTLKRSQKLLTGSE